VMVDAGGPGGPKGGMLWKQFVLQAGIFRRRGSLRAPAE